MAYVIDFTKDPNSLILGLINDNNNCNLTENEVELLTPEVITDKPGFDTRLPVRWKTTPDMVGVVNVYYNRIDLAVLFSLTGISLKEVNLDLDESLNVIMNEKFYTELARRYGVVFSDADFSFTNDSGTFTLAANPLNRAYKGSMGTAIERSLFTRIQDPILDGFSILDPNDISLFVTDQALEIFAFPDTIDITKQSAELLTYGIDCTDFQSYLAINSELGTFVDFAGLRSQLDKYFIPEFTAPGINNPARVYATSAYPGANTAYTHVVVIEDVISDTMAGKIMLHHSVNI